MSDQLITEERPRIHPVTITVNRHPVRFQDRRATGLEIKTTAIAQGVNIRPDFALFRVEGSHQHPVGDSDEVTLHEHEQFLAVAPDDNS